MDRDGAHRVVNLGNLVKELNSEHHKNACNQARDSRAKRIHNVATSSNSYQTSKRGVEGKRYIGLAIAEPGKDHGCKRSHCSGEVGVKDNEARVGHYVVAGHGNSGSTVEAKPAEPEDKHAKRHGRHVVAEDCTGLAILVKLANTRPQQVGAQTSR